MYRLGLVDTLVTHANVKGFGLTPLFGDRCGFMPPLFKTRYLHIYYFLVVDIVYQKEVTFEEVNVENEIKKYCQSQNIKVMELWGSSLYHASDIPCRNIPDNYTQFRKEVENKARIRPLQNMPDKLKPLPKELPTGNMPNIENLYSG